MRDQEWPMHHKNQVPVVRDIFARLDELTEQVKAIADRYATEDRKGESK